MTPKRRQLLSVLLCCAVLTGGARAAAPAVQDRLALPRIEGQLLLRPAESVGDGLLAALLDPVGGGAVLARGSGGVVLLRLDNDAALPAALSLLAADDRIAWAEPNYVLRTGAVPGDPDFIRQWSKDNTGVNAPGGTGTPGADLNLTVAWDSITDASAVTLAIIDDSFEVDHPDLAANMLDSGRCFFTPGGGRPCTNGPLDPRPVSDEEFHGTLVAGTAAAVGNNGTGIAGAAWRASVLPLKVDLSIFAIVQAIDAALAQDAAIISISLGGPAQGQALADALGRAEQAGVLVVASAGNADSSNDRGRAHYPSGSPLPNVLAVAASDSRDRIAAFSQWGALGTELAAPGVAVLTTQGPAGYRTTSGTSFAAPHVAAVAALVKAHTGAPDYRQLMAHLVYGGIEGVGALGPVVPGAEPAEVPGRVAAGRLDAARALAGPDAGVLVIESVSVDDGPAGNGLLDPGESATLRLVLRNLWQSQPGVTATLAAPNGGMTIGSPGPVSLGNVGMDEVVTAAFPVTLPAGMSGNHQHFLELGLASAGEPLPSRYLWFETGTLRDGEEVRQAIQRWNWDEFHAWHVEVPAGAPSLVLSTAADGDIDLLLRHGEPPEYLVTLGGAEGGFYYTDDETLVSAGDGGDETIVVDQPEPGTWHAVLVNFDQQPREYRVLATTSPGSVPAAGNVSLSAADYETIEDAGGLAIEVRRAGGSGAARVRYDVRGDTATAGSDFTPVSGTLSWSSGDTAPQSFFVPVTADAEAEPVERFTVHLSDPVGAEFGEHAKATVRIIDDDADVATVALDRSAATVHERDGALTLVVTRSGSVSGAARVRYQGRDGSARAGVDYADADGVVSWGAGEGGGRQIVVRLIDDGEGEGDEDFTLELFAPENARLGNPAAARITLRSGRESGAGSSQGGGDTATNGGGGGGAGAAMFALLALALTRCRFSR